MINRADHLWYFELPAVALIDGSVPECRIASAVEFAVTFGAIDMRPSELQVSVSATRLGDFRYEILGSVLQRHHELAVVDIGILTFGKTEIHAHSGVSGTVSLSVDIFGDYEDCMSEYDDVPALIYSWEVAEIWKADTAKETPPAKQTAGGKVSERTYSPVGSTNIRYYGAWTDYYLGCKLQSITPKRPG